MTEETDVTQPIVGVRFKGAGRVFYFTAEGLTLEVGDLVVVETPQGSEIGKVVIAPDQLVAAEVAEPLSPVLRVAQGDDLSRMDSLKDKVRDDLDTARKKVEEHDLRMRLVSGDYNLEATQLTLYFTAEQRIDFRELVRDLSSSLGKRVQLFQIGERDRAKLTGGIGHCGLSLCCRSWLTSFPSISIRMAKDQDVPLNPSKISGVCGRLLCCLAFEHEQYRELRGQLPKIGQTVSTPAGNAKLTGINMPRESVTLLMLDTQTFVEMPAEELRKQYGVVVRPAELEAEIVVAEAEAVTAEAAEDAAPASTPGEGAAEGAGGRPSRRRRRRNGRRRRRPQGGQDTQPRGG